MDEWVAQRKQTVVIATVLALVVVASASVVGWLLWRSLPDSAPRQVDQTVSPTKLNDQKLVFAAAGDFGANDTTRQVLRTMAAQKPDFAIALGDFSYGHIATEQEWCNLVKNEVGQQFPFQLIAGNHDSGADYIDQFATCLPNRMATMEGVYGHDYFFDSGKLARFILISPDITLDGVKRSYKVGASEYQWLNERIDDARKQGITWVVVGMHKNCITIGEKECEIGPDLISLLAQKKVDLILQGHEHGYMRSRQLTINNECPIINSGAYRSACIAKSENDQTFTRDQGSVLVIAGTGGIGQRDIRLNHPDLPFFAVYKGANADPSYGPTMFTLTPEKLEAKFINIGGEVKDSFAITK